MVRLSDTHVTRVGRVHACGDVVSICGIGIAKCEQVLSRIPVELGRYGRRRGEKAEREPELVQHCVGTKNNSEPVGFGLLFSLLYTVLVALIARQLAAS